MFTGLVEATSEVRAVSARPGGALLDLALPESFGDVVRGESVSVSGVCLTALHAGAGGPLRFDVSRETLERSTLGTLRPGDAVNLERALAAGGRMGGHVVQGHVDATTPVTRLEKSGDFWTLGARLDPRFARYVVEKGSIALDGISLTVASLGEDELTVAVVPETLRSTTLSRRRPGDLLNVEVDVLAKYVERLLRSAVPAASADDRLRALLGS